MGALDRQRLEGLMDEFFRVRLLVVGDLVLDEYVWGEVDRVSPEAREALEEYEVRDRPVHRPTSGPGK